MEIDPAIFDIKARPIRKRRQCLAENVLFEFSSFAPTLGGPDEKGR
jgi:hypothetical protein